jgi:hypothetical protein
MQNEREHNTDYKSQGEGILDAGRKHGEASCNYEVMELVVKFNLHI